MKTTPIIFNTEMIRALLDGRKTQTRRVVKPQPEHISTPFHPELRGARIWVWMARDDFPEYSYADGDFRCHYGQPGDLLWVRETCRAEELDSGLDGVRYLADDAFEPIENVPEAADKWGDLRWYGKRASPASHVKAVPSIHMPRWASRITLRITDVRVQRVQDISEADAIAEGCPAVSFHSLDCSSTPPSDYFRHLWNSINARRDGCSWSDNPWCWAITFEVIKGNVDDVLAAE